MRVSTATTTLQELQVKYSGLFDQKYSTALSIAIAVMKSLTPDQISMVNSLYLNISPETDIKVREPNSWNSVPIKYKP